MIRELQGLGLDVRVLDENGDVVDLRNDGDEDEDENGYPGESLDFTYASSDDELNDGGFDVVDEKDLNRESNSVYEEDLDNNDDDYKEDFSDGESIDFDEDE